MIILYSIYLQACEIITLKYYGEWRQHSPGNILYYRLLYYLIKIYIEELFQRYVSESQIREHIQGVPPICWQLRTKFWKLKNHICQRIRFVLKFLNKNLSDDILKPSKIKLEVFLNWISKKNFKFQKKIWHQTPPPH